ncbi:MAG TPA: glycosyltransferase, partial [Acidimicrobiales bacterium]|nr:glycosyltransferase [Acidimicrobiales bacterium]
MTAARRVSVVINTYNRAAHLRLTLAALGHLDHPDFEVIVVNGPSTDGTEAVVAEYAGRIKAAACPARNLSVSRNIGIAMAAGDIVAFIDDDAYPDPAWLDWLAEAYDDDEVAGAGGPVFDHTGIALQSRYLLSDRVGRTHLSFDGDPSPWYNVPGGATYPSLLGTNSSFRRDRLLEIGGFDEEFEYYLDETDVCARLVDAGYVIRPLEGGYVYHDFLPNDIRGANRAARDRYAVLKNACYFALKNASRGSSFADACAGLTEFVDGNRAEVVQAVELGLLTPSDRDRFETDVPAAFDAGWQHFLAGPPKTRTPEWFEERRQPWRPFPTRRPPGAKLHVCLLSQDYPPRPLGGIGRYVHTLANGLAGAGHVVRVLTKGDG